MLTVRSQKSYRDDLVGFWLWVCESYDVHRWPVVVGDVAAAENLLAGSSGR